MIPFWPESLGFVPESIFSLSQSAFETGSPTDVHKCAYYEEDVNKVLADLTARMVAMRNTIESQTNIINHNEELITRLLRSEDS